MQTDQPSGEVVASREAPARPRRRWAILRFSMLAFGAVVVWLVSWLAIAGTLGLGTMTMNLIIPSACVVLFGLIVLRQEQKWVWPVKRLTHLLPLVHAGQLPIDSFDEIDGGSKELATLVRGILHDLKSQKTRMAELEAEMHMRVVSRTDALERTIGSLRQQASRDALTGLFNRRMLDQVLPAEMERCRSQRSNLALLMIDVDYFKVLNDTLGHASGDELLRNIAQIIRSTIRENDAAFRCGGDEFVVVLPDCNDANAEALATRINSLVTGLTKTLRLARQPGLSIGVATISQMSDPTAKGLLELADKRLYENKSLRKPRLAKAS